jgi:putative glutamine amidotransferase
LENLLKPIVGIIGNAHLINDTYPAQTTGLMNIEPIMEICNAISIVIPGVPENATTDELINICDGFIFTGGRPNVHPKFYGKTATKVHGDFDIGRDQVVIPLIKKCEKIGKPILGICRGFQEFNVAFGGSLHPEIRDLPGRMNHRMPPDGTLEEKFALRHEVTFLKGSIFENIFCESKIDVNSLHGQGIDEPGDRVSIDGHAPDGTPEAISIMGSKGFCLAVQWHPEWKASKDKNSVRLFKAFRNALNEHKLLRTSEKFIG